MTTRLDTHGESNCQKKRSGLNLLVVPRSVHSERNLQLSHPPSIWPRHTNFIRYGFYGFLGLDKPGSASSATWVWMSLLFSLLLASKRPIKGWFIQVRSRFDLGLLVWNWSISVALLRKVPSRVEYHSFRQKHGNEGRVKSITAIIRVSCRG